MRFMSLKATDYQIFFFCFMSFFSQNLFGLYICPFFKCLKSPAVNPFNSTLTQEGNDKPNPNTLTDLSDGCMFSVPSIFLFCSSPVSLFVSLNILFAVSRCSLPSSSLLFMIWWDHSILNDQTMVYDDILVSVSPYVLQDGC